MADWDPKFINNNRAKFKAAQQRREKFVESVSKYDSLTRACEDAGIAMGTYQAWRSRFPEFRARVDSLLGRKLEQPSWNLGFAQFRRKYFGMDTTWFQLLAVDAYENTRPGNITLILWPPEHGKTTLFEDYASYKLAVDPTFRFLVASEQQNLAAKVLKRVMNRMESETPFPDYVKEFGPFEPQPGDGRRQPWSASHFSVWRKKTDDERDYSMAALGITSGVAGSRTDHLHIDDVQSLKSFQKNPSQWSEDILELFSQDWLSRPGERGRTTINGTRVGEGDFYELLMKKFADTGILRVISFPAIYYYEDRDEYAPLWEFDEATGAGNTMDMLDRMKIKAGPEAWARNYMQQPLAGVDRTFDDEVLEPTKNTMRRISDPPPETAPCLISIDPGFGTNVVTSAAMHDGRLKVMRIIQDRRLTRTEEILDRLEEEVVRIHAARNGAHVLEVVIEAAAFQKGLITDRQLLAMQSRYGFAIRPHQTNSNKYDPNIGLKSMARDMRLGNIDIPYGDDQTVAKMDALYAQCKSWKGHKRGTELVQDQLMTLWFLWIRWRALNVDTDWNPDMFKRTGMPYQPTRTGLLAPIGAR